MTASEIESMIFAAFADVTREGGISWQEAEALDDSGVTQEQLAAARARDKDQSWPELVTDASWDPDSIFASWSFLDAIGYRYYLPPAMIRDLRGAQLGLEGRLDMGEPQEFNEYPESSEIYPSMRQWKIKRFSLFTEDQLLATAEYVRWMTLQEEDHLSIGDWHRTWHSSWLNVWLRRNDLDPGDKRLPIDLESFEILMWEDSERLRRERWSGGLPFD